MKPSQKEIRLELSRMKRVPAKPIDDGLIQVKVTQAGQEDVAFGRKAFKDVTYAIEGIIEVLAVPIHKTIPTKASVKLGIDVGVEAVHLTAATVKDTDKANLEITLEWKRS